MFRNGTQCESYDGITYKEERRKVVKERRSRGKEGRKMTIKERLVCLEMILNENLMMK